MAEAKVAKEVGAVVPATVTLLLSMDEARTLRALTGRVSRRSALVPEHTDRIFRALCNAGVR